MLVGRALPSLQLLGLSGQQSDGQWWRLGQGRVAKGWPPRVDMVTFYSMDLER